MTNLIRNFAHLFGCSLLIATIFPLNAQANTPLDISFEELDFSTNPTRISGSNNQAGSSYRYDNVITINGTQVNAIVTIDALHDGISIDNFDDNSSSSTQKYFAPQLTGGGSSQPNARVDYTFSFVDTSGEPLLIENFGVNSIDIDGPEFVEYGGFKSYVLGVDTDITAVAGNGNRIRFSGSGSYAGLIINDEGRVETVFSAVSEIQMTMGIPNSSDTRMFGSVFKRITFNNGTSEVSAPTVVSQSTLDTTPTITGTLAPLTGSETFTVEVNGVTYNAGTDLTVTGGDWSLTIPAGNELTPSTTYDVIAKRIGVITLPDQTNNELEITASTNTAPVAVADTLSVAEGGTLTATTVLTNDTDAEGNSLIAVKMTDPTHGALIFETDGTFTYVHDGSETTTDSFTYKANDGILDSNTVAVTINITAVNDVPVAVLDTYSVNEGATLNATTVLVNDTDVDDSTLTAIKMSDPSNGSLTFATDGTFTYAHDGSATSSDSFTYKANDGDSDSNTVTVTINITAVNDAPVAVIDAFSVNEGATLNATTVLFNDTDVDDSTLTAIKVTDPSNGSLTFETDGTFTYVHDGSETTTDSFTYKANDGETDSNTVTVVINITAINDAPVASADAYAVDEGATLNGVKVLDNDTDAEGDTLTAEIVTEPSNGTLTFETDGTFIYVHDGSETTTDSFTYKANDSTADSNIVTVTITVNPVNDVPVAIVDNYSVDEGATLNGVTVLDNDTDAEGDTLTAEVVTEPSNGTLTFETDGTFIYVHDGSETTTDSFTYKANDSELDSNTVTVTITVNPVNDVPTADDQTVSTNEDTSIVIMLNGTDPENDTLAYSLETTPANGSLVINENQINYAPTTDFNGADSFTFTVNDGTDDSNVATVNINVLPVNDGPIDQNESITITDPNEISTIDVINNASDPDGDTLSVISARSKDGAVIINDDGTVSFIPNEGFIGQTTITYIVSDGNGGTYTAEVVVNVEEGNLPPIAIDDQYSMTSPQTMTFDVLSNDSDPENDPLTLLNVDSDFGLATIVDNAVRFVPNDDANGDIFFTYVVTDGINEGVSAQVLIAIDGNVGPVITLPDDICEENTVNASALYTSVDLGYASAVDRFGNALPVSLLNNSTLFPPGRNEAVWSATDTEGNTTFAIQYVCVNPLVSINKDQTILEGQDVKVGVYLNGAAPVYPVTIPYSVSGSAGMDDHDLQAGTLTITSGTQVIINFTTFADDVAESDEIVTIALSDKVNLGSKATHVSTITEANIAPEIGLTVTQMDENRLTVSQSAGVVDITANVFDPNTQDTLSYEWSSSHSAMLNTSTTDLVYRFDPSVLSPGLYTVTLETTDDGVGMLMDIETVYIEVVESLELLSEIDSDGDLIPDSLEGFKDSDGDGIADYLDRIMECNVLPESVSTQDGYLVEGDAGVCLRRGDFTIGKETGGAQLTDNDIMSDETDVLVADPEAINIGGIFDYIAYGLPDKGVTYGIVIPQRRPIPIDAVYRKFSAASGWGFFVEDTQNSIWSTQGEPGYCPPPNTNLDQTQWTPGLTPDHWCVQLIIQDGGPNDDDGIENGTIVDPGGVSVMLNNNLPPVATMDTAELFINSDLEIDVLGNDSDPDADPLTLTTAVATIGSVSIVNDQLLYTAPNLYVGPVTITYGIRDGNGGTDQANVLLTILPNLAPLTDNFTSQITQGENVSVNLLNTASDPESDDLRLVSVNNQNVTFNADGTATFTPDADFFGVQIIEFTIEDTVGNQVQGQWQVTVIQLFQSQATTTGGSMNIIFAWLIGLGILLRRVSLCALLGTALGLPTFMSNADDSMAYTNESCLDKDGNYEFNFTNCDNHLGWFFGGEIGQASTATSGSELDRLYQNTGINAQSIDISDADTAGSLFVGYQFSTYFGLSVGYINLGERDVNFRGSSTDLGAYYNSAEEIYPQSARGTSIAAHASYPISEDIKIAAKLGWWDWDGQYKTLESANSVGSASLNGADIWFGLEVDYRLNDYVQLFASASRFELSRDTNNMFSIGARYYWNDETLKQRQPKPIPVLENKSTGPASVLVPADADNDGVIDINDQCQATPITHRVDALGCSLMGVTPVNYSLVLYFAHDSSTITPEYDAQIKELAEFVVQHDIDTIEILGHTSALGTTEYNQRLSQKRSEALGQKLVKDYGLKEEHIVLIGLGESQLLDNGNTEAAHKINRRIEISLQAKVSSAILK